MLDLPTGAVQARVDQVGWTMQHVRSRELLEQDNADKDTDGVSLSISNQI